MIITATLIPAADCVLLLQACNCAGYRTFDVMVLKCTHYITRITLNIS